MAKLYQRQSILIYLGLVVLFKLIFSKIVPVYLHTELGDVYPIDTHVGETGYFFDGGFVEMAGRTWYKVHGYFCSFFLVDFFFPMVYSLTLLSIGQLLPREGIRRAFFWFVLVGMFLDYGENFSFATFLLTGVNSFAWVTAYFTSFKTVFFAFNVFCGLFTLLWWLGRRLFS